jgi:hypothetical protein
MLHSASRNLLQAVRVITNPPVALKEPFNFNRSDPKEYSLVEQKTLRDLGRAGGLPEWKITAPRELLSPQRVKVRFPTCPASLPFDTCVWGRRHDCDR